MSEPDLPEVQADVQLIEGVSDFLEPLFGGVELTYHEIKSHVVHIDAHRFEETEGPGFYTFVTTGMGSKPMNVPANVSDPEKYRYAELVMHLPLSWPMEWEELSKPENMWPISALMSFAGLPHRGETFVWIGHTMEIGEQPNTKMSAALICPTYVIPEGFQVVQIENRDPIPLLTVVFIYPEELEFCKVSGSEAFFKRLRESGLTPIDFYVLDKNRKNICA